ncbi:MAG: tRNA uridine-5-carboxymethylaminomethyl(34) synthesis GTPase MnmE [Acidobacteriia bacterium]|nr:tRNA uridine-5-carboxymethylaminomethyl(34) synthesis GTPase MnmE [Terriglobia bacterium]
MPAPAAFPMHDLDATIVAGASPPGRGGVGCVRISGPAAFSVAGALFTPGRGGPPVPGGPPRFGRFLGRDGRALDHGFLVLFVPGASYTGEATAELWPHGSPAVLAELVQAAVASGALPAGPGEFTYRALRRGRLDLARAEAVRDLVAARTLFQARVAFAQAEGALSRRLRPLRESLADLVARGEAAVEFVEESETHLPPGRLERELAEARETVGGLLAGFRTGRIAREGAALAIAGAPNVGKSSLFNRLLERDRAIVAPTPGTTRDTLEECVDLDGIPLRLVDTAGVRELTDAVEAEGVRRAREAVEQADLVLLVLDASRDPEPEELAALDRISGKGRSGRRLVALNKSDLPGALDVPIPCPETVRVSALTGLGLDELRALLLERLVGEGPVEEPVLTDARHAHALEAALEALERAARTETAGLSEELVLEDLHDALRHLAEITGELAPADLYERIFSTFCIGK